MTEPPSPTLSQASNQSVTSNERRFKQPQFDEFLQVFIATRDDYSFYIDLEGNFDLNFKRIKWSDVVLKTEFAAPYIVAYLQNSTIEVKNIFNPEVVNQ